jgi:DNA-binding transcriptional ArsR family regulator
MSSGVDEPGQESVTALRATAHPVRLRILSLLTGAAMSAAEVARELDLTHANASYHLRQLRTAGLLVVAEEISIRGGKAKRYRHEATRRPPSGPTSGADRAAVWRAVADELLRRAPLELPRRAGTRRAHMTDAELWVAPQVWADVVGRIHDASVLLHDSAQAPRTEGTVRVSATVALFEMGSGDRPPVSVAGADDADGGAP